MLTPYLYKFRRCKKYKNIFDWNLDIIFSLSIFYQSSQFYNMSARHEQYICHMSATLVQHKQQECDISET